MTAKHVKRVAVVGIALALSSFGYAATANDVGNDPIPVEPDEGIGTEG